MSTIVDTLKKRVNVGFEAGKSAPILVVGAGMGGLATAIRLAAAGCSVRIVERMEAPGGKMRTVPSPAGPADAGPTVLTMRHQFDALFALAGERMEDHLKLIPEPIVARHWWPDGSTLDLHSDRAASVQAVRAFAGADEAAAFNRLSLVAGELFERFEDPVMEAAKPSLGGSARAALGATHLFPAITPGATLARSLVRRFRDPRLRQLFGRYATYVGGFPSSTPAMMQLIWHAEESGVWHVKGGMHRLAQALADLAGRLGVSIEYGADVQRLELQSGRIHAVQLADGIRIAAPLVIFNGDPRALFTGELGRGPIRAVKKSAVEPRSLSARVWAFAAEATGPDLIHHNVFFGADPAEEFGPIAKGEAPEDPTLYVCAQDRGGSAAPTGLERFEIIENAAPTNIETEGERDACQKRVFSRLRDHGLRFSPTPGPDAVTLPADFAKMFPGSLGSIYGRSPHGMMSAFQRPTARTLIPGLYLAGGGVHPGAGIAMAALSGKHAADTIMTDLASTFPFRKTVTHGGTSTA